MNNKYSINDFDIIIASLPNRNNCVCEIYYKNNQWSEISQEENQVMIQFYPHPFQDFWEFPLDVALQVLCKAKEKYLQ